MKTIFMLGDFTSENGPGIANKSLKENIENSKDKIDFKIYYSVESRIVNRIVEILKKVCCSDLIVICNFTRLHVLAVFVSIILQKDIIYRMHGLFGFEEALNGEVSSRKNNRTRKLEKYILSHSTKIITVSKTAMKNIIREFPEYKDKVDYCYNSIDIDIEYHDKYLKKNKSIILSTGGGMRQKNNYIIAKAIDQVIKKGYSVDYYVVGSSYTDREKIESFEFVHYIEKMPHKELITLMCKTNIYVQDSSLDTFGLAIVEAAMCGCKLILANNIGAREVIDNYYSITNCDDIEAISNAIVDAINSDNPKLPNIDFNMISGDAVAKRFLELCD